MATTTEDLLLIARGRRAVQSGEIAQLRKAADLTQLELASARGVSKAAVCRWEAGDRRPRGETAMRLARVLDLLERAAA